MERYAAIFAYLCEQGAQIPTNDIWIAASAMQYGLKLITTDKHYLKLPQIYCGMLHIIEQHTGGYLKIRCAILRPARM